MKSNLNLAQTLFAGLSSSGSKTCFTAINKDLSINVSYSGYELLQKSLRLASALRCNTPEQRIILSVAAPAEFVTLFLAGIFSGKVIIPTLTPRSQIQFEKISSIAKQCNACHILCDNVAASAITNYANTTHGLTYILSDELLENSVEWVSGKENDLAGFKAGPNDIAYVQYSSGSYGDPKGVALTQKQVLSHILHGGSEWNVDETTTIGTWLPLYHDMGLVHILGFAAAGAKMVVMTPLSFVQKPVRWLQMISRYGVTVSGGPAFAYELCTVHVKDEEKSSLDLSSWKNAFFGSEIVKLHVVEEFASKFKTSNFNPSAAYVAYGMAEATCYVCGYAAEYDANQDALLQKHAIKPCILSAEDHRNVIVIGDDGSLSPDGRKGEIYVSLDSLGVGYITATVGNEFVLDRNRFVTSFEALGSRRWFRTGDIGMKIGLHLWILGRKHDMFKVNGENVLAVDVETLASKIHPNLNSYGAAAFRTSDEQDHTANLLIETYEKFTDPFETEGLIKKLKAKVFSTFGLQLQHVIILKRGTLSRTSSGKIRRNEISRNYAFENYQNNAYVWEVE